MFPNVTVKEQVMFHTVLKTEALLDDPKRVAKRPTSDQDLAS